MLKDPEFLIFVVVVHPLRCIQLLATAWTAACQASLSFTISQSLLRLMSIKLVMPSNHLILCCSLLLLPPIFPNIRVFSKESGLFQRVSSLHQVAKVLELQLQHQSFQWIFSTDFFQGQLSKDQKMSSGPIPGNLHPFPKIAGIILPFFSLWNYPADKS